MQISTTETVILLVGALVWLIGYRVNQKQKKPAGRSVERPARSKSPRYDHAENSLLTSRLIGACFGDSGKADRLIQYEKKRALGISHTEAMERALERLEADRSRS